MYVWRATSLFYRQVAGQSHFFLFSQISDSFRLHVVHLYEVIAFVVLSKSQ